MQSEEQGIPEVIDPVSFLAFDYDAIVADNQRYQTALESVNLGVFEYYAPIDHFEANHIWYDLTGISRGQGIEAILRGIPERDRGELRDLLRNPERTYRSVFTSRYEHPTRGSRWISVTGFVTDYGPTFQQGLPHYAGSLMDVTEWKTIQEEFATQENTLYTAFENLPVALMFIDSATKKIDLVNKSATDLFGLPAEAMVGKRCHHFICSAPEGFCPVCDLGKDMKDDEQAILRTDGSRRWVLKSVIRIQSNTGEKLLECFVNITERKAAEEAFRQTANRLKIATMAGGVGIWNFDIEKDHEEWDDQMYRLYAATRDEFPSGELAWQARIHPDDREFQDREIERAIDGEKDYNSEFRIVWPNGETHIIRAFAMLQTDEGGKPAHLIGTNWDITAQKETEHELIRSNLHLEAAGIQANKLMIEAEAANVAKGAFLATISHEIRTPMNGVIGMSELLLGTDLTEEQRKYAELLKASGETLLSLINDVLDFSKIEARKLELEKSPFDLRKAIEATVDIMSIHAREKGLAMSVSIDEEMPELVIGDEGRVRQILVNLVGNAIKFTERGSVSILVRFEGETEAMVSARFSVTDTGIGIPPDKQKNLFAPFTQLDNAPTRKYGGSGLGLAISRQLTELMGGRIGVSSDGKNGTTFWFTVRLGRVSDVKESQSSEWKPAARPGENQGERAADARRDDRGADERSQSRRTDKSLKILLAEDNATNQIIAVKLLEKLGHRVDVAANGIEAVSAVEGKEYDLVFMDCQMPEMDGYEATRAIREILSRRARGEADRLPIIAMTAHALAGDREKCIAAGMNDYLAKPILPDALRSVVARWGQRAGGRESAGGKEREQFRDGGREAGALPAFDQADFYSRVLNDAELARAVIAAFLADLPEQLARLDGAVASGDAKAIAHCAHRIRGAAANMSCQALNDVAAAIERSAPDGDARKVEGLARDAHAAFEEIRERLEALA